MAFLQLVFLLCVLGFTSASAKLVTTLPGFAGALPFVLETGYVVVDEEYGAELFYYFIESEGDPRNDPVLLWLTGGDRCTVLSGIVFEIGPVQFIIEPYNGSLPRLRYNPYSWTKAANILFVDSPVGAGFSFSRNPEGYNVGDVSASLQLRKFLNKWFIEHPKYLEHHFYIGGDSYAGKIVPFLAHKISEDIEAGFNDPNLNLKGYLVGNPVTGESIDTDSRVPFAHGTGIISDQLYEMILENCGDGNYDNPRNTVCAEALAEFDKLLGQVYMPHILYSICNLVSNKSTRKILKETGLGLLRNPPSRPLIKCTREYGGYLAYFWGNSKVVRDALGVKNGTIHEWVRCHSGDLPYSEDISSTIKYHNNVTSKGYRALVYSGDHDAVVPFLSTQAWIRSLNFSMVDSWRAWHLDDQCAGVEAILHQSFSHIGVLPCSSGGYQVSHFRIW